MCIRDRREDSRFSYKKFDCEKIPYEEEMFDLVIADHVLSVSYTHLRVSASPTAAVSI